VDQLGEGQAAGEGEGENLSMLGGKPDDVQYIHKSEKRYLLERHVDVVILFKIWSADPPKWCLVYDEYGPMRWGLAGRQVAGERNVAVALFTASFRGQLPPAEAEQAINSNQNVAQERPALKSSVRKVELSRSQLSRSRTLLKQEAWQVYLAFHIQPLLKFIYPGPYERPGRPPLLVVPNWQVTKLTNGQAAAVLIAGI
jgi:hypothetical protein